MKIVIEIPDNVMETQLFEEYFGTWSNKLQSVVEHSISLETARKFIIESIIEKLQKDIYQ